MSTPVITVVGSVNLDLVAAAPKLPAPGETVTGASLARHPGGKGANQALAARRLGAEVFLHARVGADAMAEEALALLRGRGIGARLVIIGDGIYLEALQALVAAHGLESQVEFHGWMMPQDIHDAINTASIVLVPSIWEEAFGLVALQAAQMGRPVIASHTGGLPEIVREGETGLLVPPDDPPALADALARLITDPARMAAMGHEALLHAQRDFDFGRFVDAYENAYQAACTARRVVSG
jgi:glycogen synthase